MAEKAQPASEESAEKTRPEEHEVRISIPVGALMIGMAALFDGLQLLFTLFLVTLPLAWLTGGVAWITFLIWFALLGVNFFGRNALLRTGIVMGTAIFTLIPGLDALPELTLGVTLLVLQTRFKDGVGDPTELLKTAASVTKSVGKVVPQARAAAAVLEQSAKTQEKRTAEAVENTRAKQRNAANGGAADEQPSPQDRPRSEPSFASSDATIIGPTAPMTIALKPLAGADLSDPRRYKPSEAR